MIPLTGAQGVIELFDWDAVKPSDTLDWVECFKDFQCARFDVPLNYSDASAGSASLAMIRLPSNLSHDDPNYRGPILFNPGGPGGSGVETTVGFGKEALAGLVGPEFDFVTFDPRGEFSSVAHTTPQINLFSSDIERALWDFNNPDTTALNGTGVYDAVPRFWAKSQILGQLVKDHDTSNSLAHFTTDNVARDMLWIVEAHNRTKINYYGISYGTTLGATFAAMFPDRIERMILDGKHVLFRTSRDWSVQYTDADKSFQLFFDGCFEAGPDKCPFYDSSSDKIKQNVLDLLESVRLNPVPVYQGPTNPYGIIDYSGLKIALQQATRQPYDPISGFLTLAQGLRDLKSGNGSTIFPFLGQEVYGDYANLSTLNAPYTFERALEAGIGVFCTDMQEIKDKPSDLLAYFEQVKGISMFVDFLMPVRTFCSGWKIHPNHFTGPVTGNTSFPILFIGNTAGKRTVLSPAKVMSSRFPGSVVLTQDSGGHTSIAAPSACRLARMREYLLEGRLPEADSICPIDVKLFEAPPSSGPTRRSLVARRFGS
ncbi:alpha/beta-hydrolase [Marasmius fiardii PR-910]|nr:alpha/beta-hydrolase [Marasmius fiardii PR-910]